MDTRARRIAPGKYLPRVLFISSYLPFERTYYRCLFLPDEIEVPALKAGTSIYTCAIWILGLRD